MSRQMTAPLVAAEPRRVAIAFEHAEAGSNMTAWAAKACLFPDDEIFLVHITNKHRCPLPEEKRAKCPHTQCSGTVKYGASILAC